jgi:hypothetical protein
LLGADRADCRSNNLGCSITGADWLTQWACLPEKLALVVRMSVVLKELGTGSWRRRASEILDIESV